MTQYTFATLPNWAEKVDRRLTAVVRQSTNDLLKSIPIEPGINRSGKRKHGSIPRDFGILANSLQSQLGNGSQVTGSSSYALVAGRMAVGDVASFGWGTEYARAVHDGANGVRGTFWVQEAATRWPSIVSKVVERAKGIN